MKTILKCLLVLLLLQTRSFGQSAVYGPLAESLQSSTISTFNPPDPANYWWSANGLDALTDGYLRTRQNVYKTRMKNIMLGIKSNNGNTYINHFYDDMEWMGISCLRAYEATGDAEYLSTANLLWTDIQGGFTGGAVSWNKGCNDCKNTCSNTPAVILGARLYRVSGNAAQLQRAKDIYTFVKNNLVNPVNGAVWDGINTTTGVVNKDWIFSYNIGTFIGAAWELYKITGENSYLNDAVLTAEYAMSNHYNGVFFFNETGGGDGGLFKGIFIRYFTLLAREAGLPAATRLRYVNALKSSAQTLKDHGINYSNMLVSANWAVPPGSTTQYSIQLSGVKLMEAAATLDQCFFYKDVNYGGIPQGLTAGSYNTAALIAKGIKDNDISSLTIPAGFTATLFENDNFQGASKTVTANQAWIGADWNDRVSSIIINALGVAHFYGDCNYGGYAVSLEPGDYTMSAMTAQGISNNTLSSLKVNSGYQVILYDEDNFQGNSITSTVNNSCFVAAGFNDKTTSIKILPLNNALPPETLATGKSAYTGETPNAAPLLVYPNPVRNELFIRSEKDLSGARIRIVDVTGRALLQSRLTSNKIDVSRLAAGVYWLTVLKDGKTMTISFVK